MSTKTKLLNYLKFFWKNVFFCDWCFCCEHKLTNQENSLCLYCLEFLFEEKLIQEHHIIIAPKGSMLEKLLNKKRPWGKQFKLLEAVMLKYFLDEGLEYQAPIIYLDKTWLKFRAFKNYYHLKFFDQPLYWVHQPIVMIAFDSQQAQDLYTYAKLSSVASFKLVTIF
jgi:hypothetical protein